MTHHRRHPLTDPRTANLGLRFGLEVIVLLVLAVWGLNASDQLLVALLLGVGAPGAVVAVWGTFVAPRAPRRLPDPARLLVEAATFALGVLALAWVGHLILGLLLAIAAGVSLGLMVAWRQRDP